MTNGGKEEERESKGPVQCFEGVFIRPNEGIFFDLLNGGHARIPQISHALTLFRHELNCCCRSIQSLARFSPHNALFSKHDRLIFYMIKTV